jgi:hypothetical protein
MFVVNLAAQFWMEVVLPFSYNEPVVRYATTALSAFHK